jgi:hypothetical protein
VQHDFVKNPWRAILPRLAAPIACQHLPGGLLTLTNPTQNVQFFLPAPHLNPLAIVSKTPEPPQLMSPGATNTPPPGRLLSHARAVLAALVLLLAGNCATHGPPTPNVDSPDWRLHLAQAVWRPGTEVAEIAGDLLAATGPHRGAWIEFSKMPVVLVTITAAQQGWRIAPPPPARPRSGRGKPPSRSAWLVLTQLLQGYPTPAGWSFTPFPEQWRIESSRTDERLTIHWDDAPPL